MSKKKEKKEKKDQQGFLHTVKSTWYILSFIWHKDGGKQYISIYYFTSILNALVWNITIIFPGLIINELTGECRMSVIITYVALMVLLPLANTGINSLLSYQRKKAEQRLDFSTNEYLYNHIARMDYETLESPEIQNLQERAEETLGSIVSVVDRFGNFLSALVSIVTLSAIISTLNPLIIVVIAVIIWINSRMTKYTNGVSFELNKIMHKFDRIQWLYPFMLANFTNAKEMRLFDLKDYFMRLWKESKGESNKVMMKIVKNTQTLRFLQGITAMIQKTLLYAYFIFNVLFRGLSVGSMTIYITTTESYASALTNVFSTYLELSRKSLNIDEMIAFFNLEPKQYMTGTKEPVFTKDSTIEFRNVWFRYPGSENYVIKDLSLKFKGSDRICIVGENGSGKTTFIKLLTRLYFPDKGEILLNGININEYDYKKYQRLFSPVFQDFITYSLSLKANIILGHEEDPKLLDEVCNKTGIIDLIRKLPKGYDTQVNKYVDESGIDLSGGEGQRVAISRALYHGGEIYLLDEPTAALDPNIEYEIYSQFNSMIQDKCAVLITHRLSAVQLADKVAVFQDGHIVGYGTHKELYAQGGLYTEMFDKQSEFYVKANEEKAEDCDFALTL